METRDIPNLLEILRMDLSPFDNKFTLRTMEKEEIVGEVKYGENMDGKF